MKDGNWWAEPGILTTGSDDPTTAISAAADQFPSEYVPMVFMTGDGHRAPPFQWATRGLWPQFFSDIVDDDKVCLYIEKFPDEVNINHVPVAFAKVFQNRKVFGWEPSVYKIILDVLKVCFEVMVPLKMKQAVDLADVRYLTKEMFRIHSNGYLIGEGQLAMTFWDIARSSGKQKVTASMLPGFLDFLQHYQEEAMELRTGIHPVIAKFIQERIDRYPDHIHLITCGDAHVKINPLYRYIKPPVGTFGIADANSH